MEMREAHTAAMKLAGLDDPERVCIHYNVFRDETPGSTGPVPFFTIYVEVPEKDRRRVDKKEHGAGGTLDAALANLRERLGRFGRECT